MEDIHYIYNRIKIGREISLVIELGGHGREELFKNINITRTVGWFTSIYPVSFLNAGPDIKNQLQAVREQLRRIPNRGIGFGILKYYRRMESGHSQKRIRFNYLGDFDVLAENEYFRCVYTDPGSDSSPRNYLTALLDINAMVAGKQLKVTLTYSKNKFSDTTIQDFTRKFKEHLQATLAFNSTNQIIDLKLSDFELVKLAEDDLENILN